MTPKKQVVFIMTDTTRFDMVGCYGFPVLKKLIHVSRCAVLHAVRFLPDCFRIQTAVFQTVCP